MAGKRKSFLNYSAARAFVIALGLTSMQDWIAYAKSENRPADIPSNPWNVYNDELASMDPPQKFNINEFIGCKLARKPRVAKDGGAKAPKAPKAVKAPKVAEVAKVAPVADVVATVEDVATDVSGLTPFEIAKIEIGKMNLKNREDFYDLKAKHMLPAGVPRNPNDAFKDKGWNGWADFLGYGDKKTAAEATA